MAFSTAGVLRLPGADRVSLTVTLRAANSANAMLTIIAIFLLLSRCKLFAERKELSCSRILSCTFGACRGREIANSCIAALTTSVAGGSGSSSMSLELVLYSHMESCSLAPHIGESS